MSVFAVMCLDRRAPVEARAIQLALPYQSIGSDVLLVSFKGTSQELSDQLGISDGANGRAMVASISSYYGYGPQNLWEWVGVHWND